MKGRLPAEIHVAVPGRLDQATGGYRYMARIVGGLRRRGLAVRVHELPGTAPLPDAAARAAAARVVAAMGPADRLVIDGLCLPAFEAALPGRALAVIHHPLALETGLSVADRRCFDELERRLLGKVARVVVTSPSTAGAVRTMGVAPERLDVVLPGTERARPTRPPRGRPVLLTLATVTPRKGHRLAAAALAGCRDLPWRWDVVGSLARHPGTVAALRADLRLRRLGRRTRLCGEVADLTGIWRSAAVFLLPSRHEGYGMAFAEAMAHGLPVVGFAAGAVTGTVPRGAGLLVRDGDVGALRRALRLLLRRRRRLARGARAAGTRLPDWAAAARGFAAALDKL